MNIDIEMFTWLFCYPKQRYDESKLRNSKQTLSVKCKALLELAPGLLNIDSSGRYIFSQCIPRGRIEER